ncbi:hypothetical protein, partial [Flavobacterium mesophilum]|uniref:hypothetical protein n=1 Tax=Flavobacterium mesophilum TaxID=3143495 RepID=UPI0031E4D6DC
LGGHFEMESGAHFKTEWGDQYNRNLHLKAVRSLENGVVNRNYIQIRRDVQELAESEIDAISDDAARRHLIIKKKKN